MVEQQLTEVNHCCHFSFVCLSLRWSCQKVKCGQTKGTDCFCLQPIIKFPALENPQTEVYRCLSGFRLYLHEQLSFYNGSFFKLE